MPRVPMQSLVAPREHGIQLPIPAEGFQATAQATANLMSSVSGAAQMVQKQFMEAQDLKNKSDISEKKRQIREAQGEFQNELVRDNIDPTEWGPRWQKRLKQLEGSLGLQDSKVPPVVREAVGEAFNNFSGTSFIQISGAALKENRKRARQNFDRDFQYLRQAEDWGGIDTLIGESTGSILDDEEGEDLRRTTELMKRKSDLEFSRRSDPSLHIEKVKNNEFALPKRQQQEELIMAERERQRQESESLRGINDLLKAGLIEDEADLEKQLGDDPAISQAKAAAYIKNYQSNKPLPQQEQFALQDRIDDNIEKLRKGQISPEEYEAEWVSIQSDVYTYGDRAGIGRFKADLHNVRPSLYSEEKLNEASNRQKAKLLKPIQTTARALVKKRADGLASIAYAKSKNIDQGLSNDDLASNAALKKKLDEHSVLFRSALQEAMDNFIMGFPEGESPSEPDLLDFLNKNADRINAEVLRKPKKQQRVKPITPEEKAQKWLSSSGSLLPPKRWKQE